MTPEEQYNALVVERDIANDNYAALANKYNRYQRIFQSYSNATPEQQQRASWLMQTALDNFNQLKLDMYAAEDRIQQAQNALNAFNSQPVQQQATASAWGQRRRATSTPIEAEGPEHIVQLSNEPYDMNFQTETPLTTSTTWDPIREYIAVKDLSQLPENVQRMVANQPGSPFGELSQGKWVSAWDYLSNVYQWWKENINPQTWVYQNNSRAPWYNLWRKLWNATIPLAVMGWAWASPSTFWVGEWALDSAKNALFRSNVNRVTNIPSTNYTTNPSNIPIKWTSPSNLPKYTTAPSNAPVPNLWRSNPSNISITPTSLTRFSIPSSVTL